MLRQTVVTYLALVLAPTGSMAMAQLAAEPSVDYSGTYVCNTAAGQSVMTLSQSGTAISGKIDAAPISGSVIENGRIKAQVVDAETGKVAAAVVMQREGSQVYVLIGLIDPDGGQMVQLPLLTYVASSNGATTTTTAVQPQQPQQPQQQEQQPAAVDQPLDQRLVGHWVYTYTYTSGDFTGVIETHAILRADGTYQFGGGRAAAGGMSGGGVTDRGEWTTGRWMAQDKTLYFMPDGAGQWNAYGRYMIGDGVIMTISGGNKKIWNRQ